MLIITCNGPGETAGWLRPLLRAIYARNPQTDVQVFYVPDDYATGKEPAYVRSLFPQARVHDPKTYLKVALGQRLAGMPSRADIVLYLGGDLFHAARLHRRFGGALTTYKFNRRRYARATQCAFAVDRRNERDLAAAGVPAERIRVVGNLAIDGALAESELPAEAGSPRDGILFMPGSRPAQVAEIVPFFFTTALAIRRERPHVPIAFGIAPFTEDGELRSAIRGGADWRLFSRRGELLSSNGTAALVSADGRNSFPIVRNALAAAKQARLAVTIPGTKVIELAVIGTPTITCTVLNAPELIAINGPLTYLNRVPILGTPLKRRVVMAVSHSHRFHSQPNIDAQEAIVRELRGTLTPGRVARAALDAFEDEHWLRESSLALKDLYREHQGASSRMADELLALAE